MGRKTNWANDGGEDCKPRGVNTSSDSSDGEYRARRCSQGIRLPIPRFHDDSDCPSEAYTVGSQVHKDEDAEDDIESRGVERGPVSSAEDVASAFQAPFTEYSPKARPQPGGRPARSLSLGSLSTAPPEPQQRTPSLGSEPRRLGNSRGGIPARRDAMPPGASGRAPLSSLLHRTGRQANSCNTTPRSCSVLTPRGLSCTSSVRTPRGSSAPSTPRLKVAGGQARDSPRDCVAELRKMLLDRAPSLANAWRRLLDKRGVGRLSQQEFCDACRRIGFPGSLRELWQSLGAGDAGSLTLGEFDWVTAETLGRFHVALLGRYGSAAEAGLRLGLQGGRRLHRREFCRRLDTKRLADSGDEDLIFRSLCTIGIDARLAVAKADFDWLDRVADTLPKPNVPRVMPGTMAEDVPSDGTEASANDSTAFGTDYEESTDGGYSSGSTDMSERTGSLCGQPIFERLYREGLEKRKQSRTRSEEAAPKDSRVRTRSEEIASINRLHNESERRSTQRSQEREKHFQELCSMPNPNARHDPKAIKRLLQPRQQCDTNSEQASSMISMSRSSANSSVDPLEVASRLYDEHQNRLQRQAARRRQAREKEELQRGADAELKYADPMVFERLYLEEAARRQRQKDKVAKAERDRVAEEAACQVSAAKGQVRPETFNRLYLDGARREAAFEEKRRRQALEKEEKLQAEMFHKKRLVQKSDLRDADLESLPYFQADLPWPSMSSRNSHGFPAEEARSSSSRVPVANRRLASAIRAPEVSASKGPVVGNAGGLHAQRSRGSLRSRAPGSVPCTENPFVHAASSTKTKRCAPGQRSAQIHLEDAAMHAFPKQRGPERGEMLRAQVDVSALRRLDVEYFLEAQWRKPATDSRSGLLASLQRQASAGELRVGRRMEAQSAQSLEASRRHHVQQFVTEEVPSYAYGHVYPQKERVSTQSRQREFDKRHVLASQGQSLFRQQVNATPELAAKGAGRQRRAAEVQMTATSETASRMAWRHRRTAEVFQNEVIDSSERALRSAGRQRRAVDVFQQPAAAVAAGRLRHPSSAHVEEAPDLVLVEQHLHSCSGSPGSRHEWREMRAERSPLGQPAEQPPAPELQELTVDAYARPYCRTRPGEESLQVSSSGQLAPQSQPCLLTEEEEGISGEDEEPLPTSVSLAEVSSDIAAAKTSPPDTRLRDKAPPCSNTWKERREQRRRIEEEWRSPFGDSSGGGPRNKRPAWS